MTGEGVGGPLDGARLWAPWSFAWFEGGGSSRPDPSDGGDLYRFDGARWVYAGGRTALCGGCGCFHVVPGDAAPGEFECTFCGAQLTRG